MSHLTCSIASRWSGVSRYGKRGLELAQPVGVGREREAAAAAALGVEVEQLAGELLGRAAGARLHRLPARAAELGERRVVAAGADVARDLRELVDRHEDLVRALELEVQVVAGDAGDGLGVEAGEAREPVVLVDDDVAGAQVGEASAGGRGRGASAARPGRGGGSACARGSRRASAAGRRSRRAGWPRRRRAPSVRLVPRRPEALQVVGGALALAVLRPGDERRVAGARELLELGLGLLQRAGGELGGLGAELDRLRAGDAREAQRLPRVERLR